MEIRRRVVPRYQARFREDTTESGEPVTIVTSRITSKSVDGHYTHLSEDSIANFAKAENITLLDSHNHQTTGYGVSTRIWRDGDDVLGDFAILQKSKWSSRMTYTDAESLLYDLRHRPFDTSAGFNSDMDVCDLCTKAGDTRDIWFDEDCEHWLGHKYGDDRATAEIRGGTLHENSLVFAGSNRDAGILSESQREQTLLKAERLLKEGAISRETLIQAARQLQIPNLRKVGTNNRKPTHKPHQRRDRQMAKSTEALEARVEELEEAKTELEEAKTELKELYDKARKANKTLKAENKDLKSQLDVLESLEDDLRDDCKKISKAAEDLREEEDRMSDAEKTEFEKELEDMSYQQLTRKRKTLTKERDIIIAINEIDKDKDDEKEIDDGDSDKKTVQPFVARGELDNRYM